MRVVVVGASGFIGSAVARALEEAGHEVVRATSSPQRAARPGWVRADVLDPGTLPRALGGAEAVVQSLTFPTFPVEKPSRGYTFMAFDGDGTEALVAAAREAGVRRYVYLSGAGASPDADRVWFRAKWRGERAVEASGLEGVSIRPSWVYGPGDRALNRFAAIARRSPVVPVIGDGRQVLQPVFVGDVAAVVSRAAVPGAPAGTFELGGPQRLTMNEVLETMLEVMGLRRRLVHVPPVLARAAGALLRHLPRPPLSPDAVAFITEDAVADTAGLLAAYPMRLTPLREGLESYLARGGRT